MKLKIPKFLVNRAAYLARKRVRPAPPKRLSAAVASRRMSPGADDSYDDEPTTRLSSAFFVVLILHVVAVGGIYAFNSIKAHRRGIESNPPITKTADSSAADAAPVAQPLTEGPGKESTAGASRAIAAAGNISNNGSLPNTRSYHVKTGDTLTKIAGFAGVTVAELQFVNPPKELATLHPGQIINVPVRKAQEHAALTEQVPLAPAAKKVEETSAKPVSGKTYEVQKGDTATSIARHAGVSVEELLKLNKISDPKKLQLGQSLKLPARKVN